MLIRIGRFDKATEVLEQSQTLFERLNLMPAPGMASRPLTALSILRGIQGDYEKAIAMGEQIKRESEARSDLRNLSFACYGLTSAYLSMGEYDRAQQNAQLAVYYPVNRLSPKDAIKFICHQIYQRRNYQRRQIDEFLCAWFSGH